jgi:hypothetical protein
VQGVIDLLVPIPIAHFRILKDRHAVSREYVFIADTACHNGCTLFELTALKGV